MPPGSSPAIRFKGPYDQNDNLGSFVQPLPLVDEFQSTAETETNRESIPTEGDSSAILTPISGSRTATINGSTSFSAIESVVTAVSGRKSSVGYWLRGLEALTSPTQGKGWRVENDVTGATYDPSTDRGFLVTDMSWEHSAGDVNRVEWSVDVETTKGVQEKKDPTNYINRRGYNSPSGSVTFDGVEVGSTVIEFDEVESRRVERSVDVQTTNLIHQLENSGAGGSPLIGLIGSGVETDVTFTGTVYVPSSFASTKEQFDTTLHGKTAKMYDSLSGTVWEGTISDSSSTLNEGEPPNRFDANVSLEVGNTIT